MVCNLLYAIINKRIKSEVAKQIGLLSKHSSVLFWLEDCREAKHWLYFTFYSAYCTDDFVGLIHCSILFVVVTLVMLISRRRALGRPSFICHASLVPRRNRWVKRSPCWARPIRLTSVSVLTWYFAVSVTSFDWKFDVQVRPLKNSRASGCRP